MKNSIGSFTAKAAAFLLAFGCAVSAWGATTVAKIGDTEYRSLQDAVNKVTTGQTIRLAANCDETALVARVVSFTLVQDEGVEFTGSIGQGSQETQIATAEGENGGTVYTMTQPNRGYSYFTNVNNANTYDPLILAYVKKEWEKTQTGVFIAGRKVTVSGTYDGEGYRDAEGKVAVDLVNHVITLNNATITATSSPLTTYTRVSSLRGTSVDSVLHNEVPYDGVVCIEEMTYNVPSSSAERGNSAGFCYWPIGYNKGSGLMATVGLAILDDENEWQVVLVGENKIVVNAGFVCPTSTGNVPNLNESGDGYGIYAKGTLTLKGPGSLEANVKNSGVSDYDYSINPGTAGVFAQNLTISETTVAATVEGVEATMSMGGMSVTMATGSKYGAVYASGTLTIEDSTVAATNKMSLGRNGWTGTSGAAIGSTGGAVTISGGTVEAQHIATGYGYDEDYNLVSGAVGVGIAATGSASGTVTITGGANVSLEASTGGISGYKGITVNGTETELSIDTTGVGLESTAGPYQISQAAVTIENAETSLEYTSRNAGSSISTGDYAANVPAEAIATGTYQYYSNGMYHITDTIPQGWVAFCNNTFFMDAGSSAEAIAVCEEGGEVYINEDSDAAKTGITQGGSFTVYVLDGKSYTGAVTTDRLKSEKTTSDTTTFDGKTYIPNTYTMVVDPERAVAKTVKADGSETYFATLAYSSAYTPPARNDVGEGGTLVLLEDVDISSLYASISFSRINWTLDLNGCKLTCGSNYYVSQSTANYTLTIKDSSAAQTGVIHQTYVPSNNSSAGSGVRCSNGTIVIESGRFTGGNTPVVATGSGAIEIRGGYFDGELYVQKSSPGTYICYGGTYTVDPVKHVADGYAAAKTVVDETDLWVVGRLDMTTSVNATSDISAEYVISAYIYDADDGLIAKLAEDQTIAVNIDTTKDVSGSTLAKFDAEKVVTTALLNAEDSSKITAIAISVQSAMTNKVESINNSTKERLGTAVYYDVKPVAEVAAAGADSTAFTIANDAIADGAEFAFDLVLPEIEGVEAGTPLYIAHISSDYDNELSYDVAREGDGGTLYVAVSTTHFSTFRVNYSTTSETAVLMTLYGNNTPTYVSYTETSLATAVSNVGRYSSVGTVVLLADIVLDAPVSMAKPARNETIVDLNGHTITLAEGVENAFVISGEGTMLTVKNGTASVGISGYPENYAVVATTVDGATTYTAAPAVAQVEIAGVVTKYADLHAALEAGKAAGSVVTLLADVDLAGVNWVPVLDFAGTFDGGNKVISNLTTGGADQDHCGLFGNTTNSKSFICNVVVSNATVTARKWAAAVVGELASSSTISNITVKGLVQITGNTFVGGIVGQGYAYFRDSRIAGDEGSFVKGVWIGDNLEGDNVGGIIGHLGEGTGLGLYDCSASGLTITGTRKIGGMVGTFSHSSQISNVAVSNVTLGTTATLEYANANKSTMHLGGIVGSYFGSATTGKISGTVEDVTILVDEFAEGISFAAGNVNYGLVAGGSRVPADQNPETYVADLSGVVAKGYDPAKYSNDYLIPKVAQVGDVKYVTFADAIAAADAQNIDEITILDNTSESPDSAWKVADGKLVRKVYVAQIGTTKYETIAAALSNAQNSETVVLIADAVLASQFIFNAEKEITLDLAGHAITSTADDLLRVESGALTVNDSFGGGSVFTDNWTVFCVAGGEVIVNGGRFGATQHNTVYVSSGSVTFNGGMVDMGVDSVGEYSGEDVQAYEGLGENAGYTIFAEPLVSDIDPPIYETTAVGVSSTVKLDAYYGPGATLTWSSSDTSIATVDSTGLVTFTGTAGTATIYAVAQNGSYATAMVAVGTATVKNMTTGTEYVMLQTAIDAASACDTLKLIANVSLTDAAYVPDTAEIVIDLDGHDIVNTRTGVTSAQYAIYNDGTLTIMDSKDDGTTGGHVYTTNIETSGNEAVLNYGTLVIEGGWFGDSDCNKTNANVINAGRAVTTYGTATLNGGHYTAIDNFTNGKYTYALYSNGSAASLTINAADIYGTMNGVISSYNGGLLTVNDATIVFGRMDFDTYPYRLAYGYYGNIVINGGTWKTQAKVRADDSQEFCDWYKSDAITITGGKFDLQDWNDVYGIAKISGGIFNKVVPAKNLATGCICTDNLDPETNVTYPYAVFKPVAQVGDVKYGTFADAIAAAEDQEPVPSIIVLDTTAEVPDGWKFVTENDVTTLVRKVYVAQIITNAGATTNKYETVEAALAAAQTAGATIEVLADSTETPDHALEVLMGGNITLTSTTPVRVEIAPTAKTSSVDTDGMAYIRSASAAARCTFTVGENVTLAFPATAAGKGAMYIGYSSANAADVVVNGRLELYEPYVGSLSTLTVNPSGSIKSISECLIVRWGATVDIVGTGAEWSDANPQAEFSYVELQGGVTRLKDTYAKGGAWVHLYNRNADKVDQYGATTLVLDNAVLATSKINNQAVIELDVDSQIVTPVVQNTGSINIDATGITQAAKIIDYTGSGTLALADYGTVNVTAGEAYVEENDLWVKKLPVAQIGSTKYESLAAAVAAAQSGDTILVIADISGEAVEVATGVTITSDDAANPRTLSNVSINATGSDISLVVKDLAFTGNSWINAANGGQLTVENVTADVSPSNGTAVNSRSTFIGLGRDESKTLALTVKNSNIVVPSGTDAILGWAKITGASIEGTTIGSASKKINSGDAVKIMGVASGATISFVGNTVYSDWNGIAIEPNTSRDNDYTAIFEKNTFVGDADHIWFDAQGSTVSHATVLATSDNTVNGVALTPANIANNDSTWTSYAGVDVETDEFGKIKSGTFTAYSSVSAIEAALADGYVSDTDANGWYHVIVKPVAQIGTTKYESLAEAIDAVPTDGTETTIQMIADSAEAANIVIAATKNVVLDLNGKTVSRTVPGPDASFITNNGTFTVKDTSASADGAVVLTASSGNYSKQTITVYNIGGIFNLESGTIRNATGTGLAYAVNNAVNWGHVSTFNMTGGTVTAPGGDADLRVYNNTAFSVSADCKNYVNIIGGTLASSGLFIDTYLGGTYSANFTGANIANQIAISGGTINGLIDLKLRHAFNTSLSITGGDFTNARMWVRKYTAEWNSSLAEPTAPYVTISGGKFAFVAGKAFGLAYDCGATSWTTYEKPYAVSGGVFNLAVPAFACAEGYVPVSNTDAETSATYPYTVTGPVVAGFSASDMEASSETEAGGIVTVANGVVSTALSGVSDIRFIRVHSADGFVTLRTSDASNTFALPDGFGTVTKVVAYCGENVTATAGAVPSLFQRVDRAGDPPCATGSFAVKSGVYYSLEANGVRTALHDNKPVAPAEDGDSLNYSVPVSPDPWGVVKFRIIVSDEPLPAGE